MQDLVRLDTDDWEDAGKVYKVLASHRRPNSTATELKLEHNGIVSNRVVAYHQIEYVDA